MAAYLTARGSATATPRITDGLLDELHSQDFKVCGPPPPVVLAPAPTAVVHTPPVAAALARPIPTPVGAVAVAPPRQRVTIIRPVPTERPRPKAPLIDDASASRPPPPRRSAPVAQPERGAGSSLPNIQINSF